MASALQRLLNGLFYFQRGDYIGLNRQACRKPVVGKSTYRILYFQDGNDSGCE